VPRLAHRLTHLRPTIFSEISALAQAHGAINLGQGFPDFDAPEAIKEVARQAIADGVNQYPLGSGIAPLRQAIAEHAERFYGQRVDPGTMVTVTSGATEAIFDAVLGLVDPGDEVVLFEPFYDSYEASVRMAGGVPRFVLLRPPDAQHPHWWFDPAELEAQFGPKTRAVLLNTPHNPTGKVFTRGELEHLGALCERHDVVLVSDEVYEHLVYGAAKHQRPAMLPGLADRTVTISSAGKSFSVTGWKIGWAIAPPELRAAVQSPHQYVTFASAAPLQVAVAAALRLPDAYFAELASAFAARADLLLAALCKAGLEVYRPQGAYFVMADLERTGLDDEAFCRALISELKVAAIPPSGFYGPEHRAHGQRLARFAFCKRTQTLLAAAERLLGLPQWLAERPERALRPPDPGATSAGHARS
jgi:N-succinyldiaminopimelate aminotransferase